LLTENKFWPEKIILAGKFFFGQINMFWPENFFFWANKYFLTGKYLAEKSFGQKLTRSAK